MVKKSWAPLQVLKSIAPPRHQKFCSIKIVKQVFFVSSSKQALLHFLANAQLKSRRGMTEARNWVQRTFHRVVTIVTQSVPTRPRARLWHRRTTRVSGCSYSRAGRSGRTMTTPTRQLPSLRPSSRPPRPPMARKRSLELPASDTTSWHIPLRPEKGIGSRDKRKGTHATRRKTPSPGTRRTPSQFTPPLGAAILDKHEVPLRANHRGAKVSAAPPNKKNIEEGNLSKKAEFKVYVSAFYSSTLKPVTLLSFFSFLCV